MGHTVRRVGNISGSKAQSAHGDTGRAASAPRTKIRHKGAPSPIPERPKVDLQYQAAIKNFETGVRAFQKQNYGKAAEIFEKLVESDARDVAERAHVHLRLCRQRTSHPAPHPKSVEDYYTLGIACLNAHEFGQATDHLSKANKIKPNQDHIQYALAVSNALGGNPDAALIHLEAAFALRPENRIHARRDEDFRQIAADPRFRRLIYPAGF
jgi:tetratricopeptide (TPR) repeat protein